MKGRFTKFTISFLSIIFIFGAFSLFVESSDDSKKNEDNKSIQKNKESIKKGFILDPAAPIDKAQLLEEIKGKNCSDTLRIGEEYNGQKKYNEAEFIFQQMVNRFNRSKNNYDCYWSFYYLEFLYSLNGDFEKSYDYCKRFYTIDDHYKAVHDDENEMKEYECDVRRNFINDLWRILLPFTNLSEQFIYSENYMQKLNRIDLIISKYEKKCSYTDKYNKELVNNVRNSLNDYRERNRIGNLAVKLAQEYFDGIGKYLAKKDRKGLEQYLNRYLLYDSERLLKVYLDTDYLPFFKHDFDEIKIVVKNIIYHPYITEYKSKPLYRFKFNIELKTVPYIKFEQREKSISYINEDGIPTTVSPRIRFGIIYDDWNHGFILYDNKLYLTDDRFAK